MLDVVRIGAKLKTDRRIKMDKILFVCTGNTCRSPMAVGIFNKLNNGQLKYTAESAGLYTVEGLFASVNAIKVMDEMGIDISAHKSRIVNEEILNDAKYIVCMTGAHSDRLCEDYPLFKKKVYTLSTKDISDPFGGDIDEYRRTAKEIESEMQLLLKGISGESK